MEVITIFGIRLKELRQNLNLKQKEFAANLDITSATLSGYEKGTSNPSVAVLVEIAEYYNVSVDWLLGLDDTQKHNTNKNSIKTYADLIKFIVDISKTNMDIDIKEADYEESVYVNDGGILFRSENKNFERFFSDYKKMYNLYKNKSIDDEVYNLWLEKTLNKFKDVSINDNAEYEEDNSLPF